MNYKNCPLKKRPINFGELNTLALDDNEQMATKHYTGTNSCVDHRGDNCANLEHPREKNKEIEYNGSKNVDNIMIALKEIDNAYVSQKIDHKLTVDNAKEVRAIKHKFLEHLGENKQTAIAIMHEYGIRYYNEQNEAEDLSLSSQSKSVISQDYADEPLAKRECVLNLSKKAYVSNSSSDNQWHLPSNDRISSRGLASTLSDLTNAFISAADCNPSILWQKPYTTASIYPSPVSSTSSEMCSSYGFMQSQNLSTPPLTPVPEDDIVPVDLTVRCDIPLTALYHRPSSQSSPEYRAFFHENNSGKNQNCSFSCDKCNRVYSTLIGLSKHKQFHCPAAECNKVRIKHSCKECGKQYTTAGALKMHIRTHTLPCRCNICGKAFSRPWLLQGHIRTHTGEKPFKCTDCPRSFADRSNLRAHQQTHVEVKKYVCKVCCKSFSRMSLLNKHTSANCNGNYNYAKVDVIEL